MPTSLITTPNPVLYAYNCLGTAYKIVKRQLYTITLLLVVITFCVTCTFAYIRSGLPYTGSQFNHNTQYHVTATDHWRLRVIQAHKSPSSVYSRHTVTTDQ